MTETLFRPEVIAARQKNWLGTIKISPPRMGWLFFSYATAVVVAIAILLICGQYTRRVRSEGRLAPSGGLLTIIPPAAGVVTRMFVREGDVVKAGQPLLEVSAEQGSAEYGGYHEVTASQLKIKREKLQDDLREENRGSQIQTQQLQSRIRLLQQQMAETKQQIVIQKKRADSADSLYRAWAGLGDSGVVSKMQLLQQQDTALQNQAQLKDLSSQYLQLEQQRRQLQGELDVLPMTAASRRNDIARQLADIAQALSQNAAQKSFILKAPESGRVSNLFVHPGQIVSPQQSVATVLPKMSSLVSFCRGLQRRGESCRRKGGLHARWREC